MSFALEIAARTVWMEARGEPEIGQRAVAHVLVNRTKDGRWGHDLATVCLWPAQFSSWNAHDGNRIVMAGLADDDPLLARLQNFVADALQGVQDPASGATHYFAATIPDPPWVVGATFCGQFGRQKFYKDVH